MGGADRMRCRATRAVVGIRGQEGVGCGGAEGEGLQKVSCGWLRLQ